MNDVNDSESPNLDLDDYDDIDNDVRGYSAGSTKGKMDAKRLLEIRREEMELKRLLDDGF